MHVEILIPISFFFLLGYIIHVVSTNNIKRRLIEKGMVDENLKFLYADKYDRNVPSSLKWGMVLTTIGLAVLVARLIPAIDSDEMTLSLMLIFGGIALISYYFIATKLFKKNDKEG
jgi:hypothetical protein